MIPWLLTAVLLGIVTLCSAQRLRRRAYELGRLWNIVNVVSARHYPTMPLPPERLRLHVGMTAAAANFLSQGVNSSQRVIEIFGRTPTGPVLDWGCGSGRTLRWLLFNEAWRAQYYGCDVDGEAIRWLKGQGPFQVQECAPRPPLPYPNHHFEGLFAFSVLTHIDPGDHRAWYAEMHRILKPGALVFLTTLGSQSVPRLLRSKFRETGALFVKHRGHYKSAAYVAEEFTRKAMEGYLMVEQYQKLGYQNGMDTILARRAP